MPNRRVDRRLLNAKSAAQDAVVFTPRTNAHSQQGFYNTIAWGTGVASGVVTVEVAHISTYTGTWAPVAVVTFAGTAPKEDYVYIPGQPKAIRNRISTVLVGGTVSSYLEGAE